MSLFADYAPRAPGDGPRDEAHDVALRVANPSDAEALAALAAERNGTPLEEALARFGRILAEAESTDRSRVFVAEHAGEVVGYGVVHVFTPAADAPPDSAPAGWYLGGVIVSPTQRRRGIGHRLTAARLAWVAERSRHAHYVSNARNRVSIDLHARFGFEELTRDFHMPRLTFSGGVGILFRATLPPPQAVP